ncbi:unnamed protein product [Bodo saltans]|uniref:Uncharacterized protein n=1 Tax=Bodo saltans TaxID=75058 RepID=A0A0S4KIP3_BODSA|nr:unnamed protein product [Bodo saltans]|eukprot:CUI14391.1 unnamed protein product [Bodo saltans]
MEVRQHRKQLDNLKRNESMAHRDAERHAEFLKTYKTAEQLAAEAATLEVERLQRIIDSLRDHEDDDRMLLEEEEAVENKLMLQLNRLSFVSLTVAVVHAEYQKLDNQKQLRVEEQRRVVASYEKLKVTLSSEETEKRRQVERACTADWRVFENMKRTDYRKVELEISKKDEEARKQEESAQKERNVQEDRIGSRLLEEEEDELVRAYEECALRISTRFQALTLVS